MADFIKGNKFWAIGLALNILLSANCLAAILDAVFFGRQLGQDYLFASALTCLGGAMLPFAGMRLDE